MLFALSLIIVEKMSRNIINENKYIEISEMNIFELTYIVRLGKCIAIS